MMARSSMASCVVALAVAASSFAGERELIVHNFQQPSGTVTLGSEFPGAQGSYARHRDSDDGAWHGRLSYELTKGAYVALVLPATLHEGSRQLSFRVRCSAPNTSIHLKTTDDAKQEHIRRQVLATAGEWETVTFEVEKFASAWHGPEDDKRIHWPVRMLQIGVERNAQAPIGNVDLADMRVLTSAPAAVMPSLLLHCEASRFGALFYPDERPTLRYFLESLVPGEGGSYQSRMVVKDWQGREVFRRDSVEALGIGEQREAVFTPVDVGGGFGAFEFVLTLRNAADAADAVTVSSWFGRLSSANPPPCTWLGTGIHGSHGWANGDLRFIDIFSAVGIGVVREEFPWAGIEKNRGEYAVTERMEDLVNRLNERGVRLNLLLSYGNGIYDNPLDPTAYAAWCAFMAEHFRGRVDTFEIWNEPANFAFRKQYGGQRFGDAPWIGKFVELSLAAGAAIRDVQPAASIAVCAEDYWPTLTQMIAEGIGPAGNVLSIHPYCHGQPRPEREMFLKDHGKELRDLSRKHGGPERVILTEVGWTTYEGAMDYLAIAGGYPRSSYVHQAQYIIRMYLSSRAAGAEYALQYDFKNDGSNRSYTEHNFGLVHEDYTPKPSITAIAALTRLLGRAEYRGDLSQDDAQYRLYHFDADGVPVVAAYAIAGTTELLLPKAFFRRLRVFDLQGNDVPFRLRDGDLAITLTETPVYIRGLDVKQMGRKLSMTLKQEPAAEVVLGEVLRVTPLLANHSGRTFRQVTCRWTLSDAADGKELVGATLLRHLDARVQHGAEFSLPAFEIPLQGDSWRAYRDRRLLFQLSVDAAGVSVSRRQEFTLREPLALSLGTMVLRDGRGAIPLALAYRGAAPAKVVISAQAAGLVFVEPALSATMQPGERKLLWLEGAPGSALPAKAVVELTASVLDSGWQYRGRQTAYLGVLPRLQPPPALAGDWSQWQGALAVLQDETGPQKRIALPGFSFQGDGDLQAKARLGWHERGLYLAVLVQDDQFFQPYSNNGEVWNGDSLQIGISGPTESHFLELAVAKFAAGAQCVITEKAGRANLHADDILVACTAAGTGQWLYELCVPWSALPALQPQVGAAFRFSLLVNDNDGAGRKGWLELHGGIGYGKDVTRHGLYSLGQ